MYASSLLTVLCLLAFLSLLEGVANFKQYSFKLEGPRVKFLISEHLENQTLYEMEQHCLFNNFHFFTKVSLEVQSFHKGLKNHFVILLEAFQSLLDSGLFCLQAEL